MAAVVVTPEVMRSSASRLSQHIETVLAIVNQYLAQLENPLDGAAQNDVGTNASYATAAHIDEHVQKILIAGARLTGGLNQAAVLMESHSAQGFHSLFDGEPA